MVNSVSATDNNITQETILKENNLQITNQAYNERINETTINKNHNEDIKEVSITNTKKNSKLTINKINTVKYRDNITISGKITNTDNTPLNSVNIQLNINGKTTKLLTDKNGTYTTTYTPTQLGKNNITITYKGNTKYNPTNLTTTFTVEKIDPSIRLSGSEIHPGVEQTFVSILPYDATGTVTLKIDKTTIANKVPFEDGFFMYTYLIPKTYNSEEYTLYLTYSGDKQYKSKTMNVTLTLTPEGGKIPATMNMANFTGKYLSSTKLTVNLNKNATGTVTFKINNKTISNSVEVKNGKATYNYNTNITPGFYNITAVYSGNYMYEESEVNSTINISKINSKITMKNISSKAGKITLFTVNLTDTKGNPISNNKIAFKLNDKTIGTNKTNEEGIAILYYKLPSSLYNQKYNITVKSTETKTCFNANKNITLTLNQLKTKVIVPSISTTPSKKVVITATILDEFNNYVTKGTVTFVKDNITIGKASVSNGFATLSYESNYEVISTQIYAYYKGDWKYANATGKGSYKVTMIKTVITSTVPDAKPNSAIVITATVRDQNQNPATDGKVKFSVSNKEIGTATVKNGVASIRYELKECSTGTYRVNCEYYDSKIYKGSATNNTLTVTLYETTIKGNEVFAIVGENTEITLSIIDEDKYNINTGTVNYYLNNKLIGSTNVSNGISTLIYKVPAEYDGKTVRYYATYLKNNLYDSSSYSNTLTVSHQKNVYVSPTGSDSNLGDKAHPFKTLKYAVEHITLFGTINLASGTYSASGLSINNSISIIGNGRDNTIITGQNSGQPVFNISKRNVVLTLDNLTIKDGKSNYNFTAGAIVSSGRLNIKNSRFINNIGNGEYSGGAIYTNGILNVSNTEFINNSVTNINSQGGAIRTYNNATYITNCKFESNKVTGSNSTGGAAIYSDTSDVIITTSTFTKNSASGKYITGGVIRSIEGALVIISSTFNNNVVKSTDYAMGGVIGSMSCGVSLTNSLFNYNTITATNTAGGGVIYIETAALDMNNTNTNANNVTSVNSYGGALYGYKSLVTITGGNMNYNNLNSTLGFGGAIYSYYGNLTIDKTKFLSNNIKSKTVALAGAIYSYSELIITNAEFTNNKINATNIGGGAIANLGNLTVSTSNFINNNAVNCGNAITSTNTSKNYIENNYWYATNPEWSKLLFSVNQPNSYSTTKFNN